MTAPRLCRNCGARLWPDVMWCTQCYEPVRQLTPRDRQLPPLREVEEPPPWVRRSPLRGPKETPVYSPWRAGPTTFGPVGRILITIVVVLVFPSGGYVGFGSPIGPLLLWYLLGYTVFATLVLRGVWRKERVYDHRLDLPTHLRRRVAERAPVLARPIRMDARLVVGFVGVAALGLLLVLWIGSDMEGRFTLVATGSVIGLGMLLAWWNEL